MSHCPTFDVEKRIEELRSYLDPKSPNYQPKIQHINIKAVIKLYEEKKFDGTQKVFIKDGKIVPREETFKGLTPSFIEGIFFISSPINKVMVMEPVVFNITK